MSTAAYTRPLADELRIRRERIDELRASSMTTYIADGESRVTWPKDDGPHVDFMPHAVDRFDLQLSNLARNQIRDELCFGQVPGRMESGGYLLSFERPRMWGCEVVRATEPPAGSRHTDNSVLLSDDLDSVIREWDRHLKVAGCWHCHPQGTERPSDQDLRAWAARLRRSGNSRWIGLLVTRGLIGGEGWSVPRLHAFVVEGTEKVGYRCTPALVNGRS